VKKAEKRELSKGDAPETAADALNLWDNGSPVTTVEMGGIGPGYEQCIQVLAFETIRALKGKKFPDDKKAINDMFDAETHRIDREFNLGLSGAQTGAGKNLAYIMLRDGWRNGLNSAGSDRWIIVSKHWPKNEADKS
jgi:hypothetical protein